MSVGVDADVEAASFLGEQLIASILADEPVKGLVDNGAPLWYQNEEGTSCLHAAAYRQDTDLVKYLIERGAIWNAGVSQLVRSRVIATSIP